MKAIINSYHCLEHDPIEDWQPENPADINVSINFTIGLEATSRDNFLLHVITPSQQVGSLPTKYTLVIDYFKIQIILTSVQDMLEQCQGNSWEDITQKLSQFMQWEFENYKP